MRIVVTGGAGFIGSALVRRLVQETDHHVLNIDSLTYAANLDNLQAVDQHPRYRFERIDVCSGPDLARVFGEYRPDAVMHLAAESHVDRSIDSPMAFVQTNVVGTCTLLQVATAYWRDLEAPRRERFRFLHVSTDEVFGSLGETGFFTETTPYNPNSPYSASKAASDHMVRAWHHTYGLPTLMTNCSNNYGPCQFPEKLIPLMILRGIHGESLPVYGTGQNIRDWLFVDDHAEALQLVLERGRIGASYNIGGRNELTNLDVVHRVCDLLDELAPSPSGTRRRATVTFVPDRPGHDLRYAIDAGRIEQELGWKPRETFASGLRKTVEWYLANEAWWQRIRSGSYRGERLGLAPASESSRSA